jgi:integrase
LLNFTLLELRLGPHSQEYQMAKRKQVHARLYWRTRSDGAPRAWGDFREYAAQGGKREPLVAPGQTRATSEPIVAQELFAKRLRELGEARENCTTAESVRKKPTIAEVVAEHIAARGKDGHVTEGWVEAGGVFLGRAITFFGESRRLGAITPDHVLEWVECLRTVQTKRGRPLTEGSIRHHINALSSLYRRAQRRRYVAPGYNPVALLDRNEKPQAPKTETRFLEVPEGALLLEAARTYPIRKHEPEMALAYPMIATFLLTGGRAKEVLGLRLEDVSTDRKTVTFRPNQFHQGERLKTRGSARVVPLVPQLQEILQPLLDRRAIEGGSLLFRSPHVKDREAPLTDLRDLLDRVATRAGWKADEIRTRLFRVTYATARLQTLDRGAPVSPWTVEKELGHGSREMLEEVYGRLGQVRHRSEVVEYRVEQHFTWSGDAWVPKPVGGCDQVGGSLELGVREAAA